MKDWDQFQLVLAIHRAGTIRGAAALLEINHATVSRRLAQLSGQYDAPIFDKVTGGYKATELGLELAAAAERIERLALEADRKGRAASANLSGSIRVSMGEPIAQLLLRDELLAFARTFPNIDLTIETSTNLVDLNRSEADVVIRSTANPPEHLVGRRLFPYALCEYSATDYLEQTPIADRQWLTYSLSLNGTDWIKESSHPDAPIALKSDDLIWLLEAAKSGQGMVRTACYMADQDPDLRRLPGARIVAAQDLWVLTHPDLKAAPRITHLMKHLADALVAKRDLIQGRV